MQKVIICLALSVIFSIIIGVYVARSQDPDAQYLQSQDSELTAAQVSENTLLHAAEMRDWPQVQLLLKQGVNPNITAFHPRHPIPQIAWRERAGLERPSPLSMAATQGDADAVRMLLHYGANPNIRGARDPGPLSFAVENLHTECARLLIAAGADVNAQGNAMFSPLKLAQLTGNHELAGLLEDAAKVPLSQRSVPQEPLLPNIMRLTPRLVPDTEGAVTMHHMLWAAPDKMVVVFDAPRRFVLVDVQTGWQTPLPELSRQWEHQEQFDADMLAISPQGRWLVGYGGTAAHPTWLATEVYGTASYEWPRTPLNNSEVRSPFAWIDEDRWMELAWRGVVSYAKICTRGQPIAQDAPIEGAYRGHTQSATVFRFSTPTQGIVDGDAGFGGGQDGTASAITWQTRFLLGPGGWRSEPDEVEWKQSEHAGYVSRAILSPKGDQLAWLCSYPASSEVAILLSKPDGTEAHVTYEGFPTVKSGVAQTWDDTVAKLPSSGTLEWTPRGDALAFWRGTKGNNGLVILPVSH